MEHYFKGKTVLVTGAGWGIGAATALLFAAYGANVIASDTSRKGGRYIMEKTGGQRGDITYIEADVSNAASCEELIKVTMASYGSINIACNNSAIFGDLSLPPGGSMEASDNQVNFNLNSLNNCMHYEIEAMQKHGGVIVNTSSVLGATGSVSLSPYVLAKYGIQSLLPDIPGEYPAIHINTIVPAFINNAFLKDMMQKERDGRMKLFPTGRHSAIQDVAALVLWLSSVESNQLPTAFTENYN